MKKEWTFGDGLEVLINQIKDERLYATFTRSPINNVTTVDTAVGLILRTGLFANEYTEWTARKAAQKSWAHFKDFWNDKCQIKRTTRIAAGQFGYEIGRAHV